jgi:large subunit ribosomal protein L24
MREKTSVKTRLVKGDRVRVITGKERGKEGRLTRVSRENGTVFVESLNIVKKAVKPNQKYPKGGLIEQEGAIPISNVMLVCGRCKKPVRIGVQTLADGKKLRICKRCGETIVKES